MMSPKNKAELFDITFVGAGPTGLFGAFYAGLREMKVKVIDALPEPGGQLIALYPDKMIFDTPGFPAILSKELASCLTEQASQWKPTMALEERALNITLAHLPDSDDEQECWILETDKDIHYSRTVVIAAGIGAFRPTKLNNESIAIFEGKGVDYWVKDINDFAGMRVLIVGGGDSAVDWSLALEPVAESVTLIHRRQGFRAHDSSVNALMESSVDTRVFYELREFQGDERLERAVLFDNRTGDEITIDVDAGILALGFKADLGPIREWGLETIGR
ncbi:MAG: NAD(P)/FAD-dependent oxidoreductase, partial [Anaerolineales bacterium]|nr:NAD(P)/FAD-dependent oxidoreductase [Anaerolineales bacterium]